MSRMIKLLLIIGIVLSGGVSSAEECTYALPVTSPCSGLLIPRQDAVDALRCIEYDKPLLDRKLELADKEILELKAKNERDVSARDKQITRLNELILNQAGGPDWYESPGFWFVAGAGVATLIAVGLASL